MALTILKGNVVSAPALGALEITEQGYLIAEDGVIVGVFPQLPPRYEGAPVEDYGDGLIVQAFADMHLHGPQYPMLGMGMDLQLMPWLQTYVFPTEARFADLEFARQTYRQLAGELVANGTTRVCMFSSLHREATLILMEELERAGVEGYVGKVNMDRFNHPLLHESTEESVAETLRWLEECGRFQRIRPILTPRFTPSCTDELMTVLGRLAKERGLPIQSHLSENPDEVTQVLALHPDCRDYWQTYEKFGLWNDRTLMAHCVWSGPEERAAMKQAGVTVVHCADSNTDLCSGTAPVRTMLREGLKVVLGSDIAGGDHLNGFDVVAATVRASKIRAMAEGNQEFLSVAEAWYLAVSAPSDFFGERPGFAPGNRLHAMVLADDRLPAARKLSAAERFERLIYRRQDGALQAVFSGKGRVYAAGRTEKIF